MTMLAAFFVLLSRYTRQHDIVVGTPRPGRTRKELEPLVGFFLNTLVIRGDLSGDPTFQRADRPRPPRHARRLRASGRAVRADRRGGAARAQHQPHAAVPDRRSPARCPTPPVALPDVRVTPLPPAKVAAKFDLTVGFGESERDITGAFEYNTDLFDRDTMRRMADQYRTRFAAARGRAGCADLGAARCSRTNARLLPPTVAGAASRRQPVVRAQHRSPSGSPPSRATHREALRAGDDLAARSLYRELDRRADALAPSAGSRWASAQDQRWRSAASARSDSGRRPAGGDEEPARRTCRSIPPSRSSGCASCSRTAAPPW